MVETLGDYYVDPHDVPALGSACRTRQASLLAAELNHTRRGSVIPDTR